MHLIYWRHYNCSFLIYLDPQVLCVYSIYIYTLSYVLRIVCILYIKRRIFFMNRVSGVLFYSLIPIYLRAFLHYSSCAKDLEKGLHYFYVHCIQLFSRSLYRALKMFHHTSGNQAPEFGGETGWSPDGGSFQADISDLIPCWYALLLRWWPPFDYTWCLLLL